MCGSDVRRRQQAGRQQQQLAALQPITTAPQHHSHNTHIPAHTSTAHPPLHSTPLHSSSHTRTRTSRHSHFATPSSFLCLLILHCLARSFSPSLLSSPLLSFSRPLPPRSPYFPSSFLSPPLLQVGSLAFPEVNGSCCSLFSVFAPQPFLFSPDSDLSLLPPQRTAPQCATQCSQLQPVCYYCKLVQPLVCVSRSSHRRQVFLPSPPVLRLVRLQFDLPRRPLPHHSRRRPL